MTNKNDNKARDLLPKPDTPLNEFFKRNREGIYGLIWPTNRFGYRWQAKCQRCNHKWDIRAKPWNSPLKMPKRCPNCWSRKWWQ